MIFRSFKLSSSLLVLPVPHYAKTFFYTVTAALSGTLTLNSMFTLKRSLNFLIGRIDWLKIRR